MDRSERRLTYEMSSRNDSCANPPFLVLSRQMKTSTSTVDHTWDDLPLECMVDFLDHVETLIFALTYSSRQGLRH
jgi:hypothetical protein